MKPAPAIVHRDVATVSTTTRGGVTLHVRRSEDPERLARLLDVLRAMVEEHRRSKGR